MIFTKIAKYILVILLISAFYPIAIFSAETKVKEVILIAGKWGNNDGEFGKESLGKTEVGYSLDFALYRGEIYIFDTMNNRIQVFDLNGNFVRKIPLAFDWIKEGMTWRFAILNKNFFALVAPAPHYSVLNDQIYEISPSGKILKKFGIKQLNLQSEEYFSNISSDEADGFIKCTIASSDMAALYDVNGNFIKYDKKTSDDRFAWHDKEGTQYRIKSNNSHKKYFGIETTVQIENPKNGIKINHSIHGDVKVEKNNKTTFIKYLGNYYEKFSVDSDGAIYHFIAVDDGVILRRLIWK